MVNDGKDYYVSGTLIILGHGLAIVQPSQVSVMQLY